MPENDVSMKSYEPGLNTISQYCVDHCTPLDDIARDLIQKTHDEPDYDMLGSADQVGFLAGICRAMRAKKTLEIGVFTGFSSLVIAKALPEDGKIIACDITDKYLKKYCEPAWIKAGVRHKIDFRLGPAKATLESLVKDGLEETFDFAFIDAEKTGYDDYYELCLRLVRPGGIIALDNTLFYGTVLPDSGVSTDITNALRKINEKLKSDDRVDATLLYLGDGTTIAVKK